MKKFITYNTNSCLPTFNDFTKGKSYLKMIDIGGKEGVLNEYVPLIRLFSYTCMEYDKSFSFELYCPCCMDKSVLGIS